MTHRSPARGGSPADPDLPIDSEDVLETLRALIRQVSSPVVQECLRAARCEIAFLTSSEGNFAEDEEEGAAAEATAERHP